MGRIRTIKPAFFTNDEVAKCSPLTRLLFVGMWTIADRDGRLEERPVRMKAELLPFDDCDVSTMLTELAAEKLITRYEHDGRNYIQITNFKKHQRPHPNEPQSEIEPPLFVVKKNCRQRNAIARKSLSLKGREGKESQEGKGTELCSETATPPSEPDVPPEVPVLEFPTHGEKKTWSLTQSKLAEYAETFPAVDVANECRKALQWCRDNPTKQKTYAGMAKFLGGWLGRVQDRGGGNRGSPGGEKFGGIKAWLENSK